MACRVLQGTTSLSAINTKIQTISVVCFADNETQLRDHFDEHTLYCIRIELLRTDNGIQLPKRQAKERAKGLVQEMLQPVWSC